MTMRILYTTILALSLLSTTAHAGGSKKNNPSGVQAWLAQQRVEAVNDMAPKIGLDPKAVLRVKATFKTCEHTGIAPDFGPYVDGSKSDCAEVKAVIHAWCIPNIRGVVRYMFAIVSKAVEAAKKIVVACVRHEVMHELLEHYGVSGHPLKVTIVRKDNGRQQTFKPAEIIRGRWPSMVNIFKPESFESQANWFDFECGYDHVVRGDGEDI